MNKHEVRYEPMLVSYIDILGFEELVKKKSAAHISRVLRIFNEAIAPPHFKRKLPGVPVEQYVSFSDLCITCTPLRRGRNHGAVFYQLLRLVYAQITLLLDEGIAIRGGVAAGDAVMSYWKFYGPAVIQAYQLEHTRAKYPRIMVDRSVLLEIKSNPLVWMHDKEDELEVVQGFLAEDNGEAYIDYLKVISGEVEDLDRVVDQHRKFITKRSARHEGNEEIRTKYEWLLKYHKRTLANMDGKTRKLSI